MRSPTRRDAQLAHDIMSIGGRNNEPHRSLRERGRPEPSEAKDIFQTRGRGKHIRATGRARSGDNVSIVVHVVASVVSTHLKAHHKKHPSRCGSERNNTKHLCNGLPFRNELGPQRPRCAAGGLELGSDTYGSGRKAKRKARLREARRGDGKIDGRGRSTFSSVRLR